MAFPVIATTSTGSVSQSFTATLPSGTQQGDLLILAVSRLLAGTTNWPTGWTALVTQTSSDYAYEARYKFAGASERNVSMSFSRSEAGQYRFLRITGHEPGQAPAVSSLASGSSTAPNSPTLNPSAWDSEDALWLSLISYTNANGYSSAPTAYPASYSAGPYNSQYPILIYASRNLNAASDDPGAFTIGATVNWFAATIAIRPMQALVAAATLTAVSSLVLEPRLVLPVTVPLTTGTTLEAGVELPGTATELTTASVLAADAPPPGAIAVLQADTSLAAGVTYAALAAALLQVTSGLDVTSTPPTTLTATSYLTIVGLLLPGQATVTLGTTPGLQVIGFGFIPISVRLEQESALEGTLFTYWPGLISLDQLSSLSAGAGLPLASAELAAASHLSVTGPFLVTGGTDLVLMDTVSGLLATASSFTPLLVVPVGPVRHPLQVPVYRLYAADTRSGRIGWELPFSTLQWNNPINEVGQLRATLVIENALENLYDQGELDPRTTLREVLTGPYRFSLVLAWGDAVVFAGPYLPSTIPSTPTIDIGAAELARVFDKRVLADPTQTLRFGPTSHGGLIKEVIDSATSGTVWWRAGRELPITTTDPPGTQGSRTLLIPGYDMIKASEVLSGLISEENAPDYRLDPYLLTGSDGLYVNWELRIGDPYLGSRIEPWTFDDTKSVVSQDIDVSRMMSMIMVSGHGQDEDKITAWWVNNTLVDQGFPALEEVDTSHTSETDKGVLDSYALASLQRYRNPVDQWTVQTRADSTPALGSYRVGDPILIDVRRHPVIPPGTYSRRITEISGDATPLVSLISAEAVIEED